MTGSTFLSVNHRIENERRAKFWGVASVKVACLQFRGSEHAASLKSRNAESLKRIFQEERGCRQEDSRHHAKALISQRDLEAVALTQISMASLLADTLPYPKLDLPPGIVLECLQGCDRVAAANEVRQWSDQRWVVDLFMDDMSDDLKRMMLEDYDYQKSPGDGELYCKIREYQGFHGEEDEFFERLWLGRLAVSENRRKNFEQLNRHKKMVSAFDRLLDIPALFSGLRLSVIHQLVSLKCDEPNLHYLKHTWDWWRGICGGSLPVMRKICRPTVEELQGRAPGASTTDHEVLHAKVRSGPIFGNFTEQERAELWSNVCNASQQCLIPSLFTFFEDLKFLTAAAGCFKHILEIGSRDTIAGCLVDSFSDAQQTSNRCIIQNSDTEYGTIRGDAATRLDFGTRQLWLAAFREYKDLPADTKKKDLLAKARTKADHATKFRFATLASRLGFESEKIANIREHHPDREIAEHALSSARKPGQYQYVNKDQCIQQILDVFATATTAAHRDEPEPVEIRQHGQPPNRHGAPHDFDYEYDKRLLFFPKMLGLSEGDQRGLTSLFIRRSVYLAYFGTPPTIDGYVPSSGVDDVYTGGSSAKRKRRRSGSDRVELSLSMIRRELDLEQDDPSESDRVSPQPSRPHQLTQDADAEQARLDRLRELAEMEQSRLNELRSTLDDLRAEEQARLLELDRLAESQLQAQERLEWTDSVSEQEGQAHEGRALVLRSDSAPMATDPSTNNEAVEPLEETRGALVATRRQKGTTRFDFEELERNPSHGRVSEEIRNPMIQPVAPKIRIEFKLYQDDGWWIIADTLHVDPSDPAEVQQVQEVAQKHLRNKYHLFDVHRSNLTPRNCFQRVTQNGTNTIVLEAISKRGGTDDPRVKRRAVVIDRRSESTL